MRTLSEVNRDLQKCKSLLELSKTENEYKEYKILYNELLNEKEKIWDTLFEGHRNMVI